MITLLWEFDCCAQAPCRRLFQQHRSGAEILGRSKKSPLYPGGFNRSAQHLL